MVFCCFFQDETDNTVEAYIFNALNKTKLIESRDTAHYHRCGRTDKTVSAFSQVISLHLRSTCTAGPGLITPASPSKASPTEIPYAQMLNGVLPKNIRIISWSPVEPDFSARFSCKGRKYRYYFPRGNLDVSRMNEAARMLHGEHDFRNFCKADIANGVTNFMRRVDAIFITTATGQSSNQSINGSTTASDPTHSPNEICILHVYGSAFLWHQVRCIAALLCLIGQGKEDPSIMTHLLDVEECPAKPQYVFESIHSIPFSTSFDVKFNVEQNYEIKRH